MQLQATEFALFILRLFAGITFIVHGWPKLRNWKETFFWMLKEKIPLPFLGTTALIIAEVFGGLFLILGIGVQAVSLLLMFVMLVAVGYQWRKHRAYLQFVELPLLMFVMCVVLLIAGGGMWQMAP